ncbi:MAG: hypothetical protein ACT4PS_10420 [Betaproteobacteria bacterium]
MTRSNIASVRMKITKVKALVKAVELAQKGRATEESAEIAQCMQAVYQVLASIEDDMASQEAGSPAKMTLVKPGKEPS